jgi:hypothetical protein
MEVERAKPVPLTLDRRSSMDVEAESRDQEFMAGNQLRLPLSGPAYQPYVSELLSFSIERLHKVRLFSLSNLLSLLIDTPKCLFIDTLNWWFKSKSLNPNLRNNNWGDSVIRG